MTTSQVQNSGVSVFYPSPVRAATNLTNATIFTRINIIADPQVVQAALESTPALQNTFCLGHLNNILVFDGDKDNHTSHVRTVLQMLTDKSLKADIHGCAFNKDSWVEAGFHIEPVGGNGQKAFMVVLREHCAPGALEDRA
ncbi:MAG: hypothetical protein Q9209_004737 [Squamulea sp. 1 TL-2023]